MPAWAVAIIVLLAVKYALVGVAAWLYVEDPRGRWK